MLWASALRSNLGTARLWNSAPPRRDAVAPVKTMVPRPLSAIGRAAAWPTRKPPRQPTRQQRSNSSDVV